MIGRRGFLGGILGACSAPSIVRASSLMQVQARPILLTGDLGPETRLWGSTSRLASVIGTP